MSKAFTKDSDAEPDDLILEPVSVVGVRNYITRSGYDQLKAELLLLLDVERPGVVDTVHWAAKNGDRSENGDYLYGKKRLREIDRRVLFLTRRLELAEIVEPSVHHGGEQVFFGATVKYRDDLGLETVVSIKGMDESNTSAGEVSWVSPLASVLLKAWVGDEVSLSTPAGLRLLKILEVRYPAP